MALTVTPINDVEIQRQKRNLTESQKRNAELTKEGVIVNSIIKDPKNLNMDDIYNSLIISDNVKMPEKLKENKIVKDKSLTPLSLIAVGVMTAIASISFMLKKNTEKSLNLKPEKKLDDIIRNVNINEEEIQGLYQMVHCPNKKTVFAGVSVIALGAMAFMGKMFIDGFKDVWVKKREADIQKNLQENLIEVETQSFSGKIQIIRNLLSEKAKEFNQYISFKSSDLKDNSEESDGNLKYFAMGALTLGSIIGLGFLSLKNLSGGKKSLENYILKRKEDIKQIISNSDSLINEKDKNFLKKIFQSIDATPEYIREVTGNLKWENNAEKNKFIEEMIFNMKKSTTNAPLAVGGDGTPKPAFNSYTSGYKAFFYNYLLDSDNPQFKMLFLSLTGLSALSYGGKAAGEAVKEVQVKKMNAQTELDLQKRLVSTELRNFKAKKDAAINPLCEEFYVQVERGKPKEELKTMAENILFEVKNGPPFVYS